ncbi:MAG TPA: DUF2232 domain-containing protein [Gemmatimonadaceae bacterium]|jgi:hypothetical protein|nr:DUF2232 domain-containing protein [Gemmatimonadaceae bacterium]
MDQAHAPAPAAPAVSGSRGQRWSGVLVALAAYLLLPLQSPFIRVLPIDNTLVLLLPLLASCFVVGWWMGGRVSLAVVWIGLAAYVLTRPPVPGATAYYDVSRAWGLLMAGSFGLVCVAGSRASFLSRALSAVGIATGLVLSLALLGELDPGRVNAIFGEQFAARRSLINLAIPGLGTPADGDVAATLPQVMRVASLLATPIVPAMLALQAVAAAALAWALYHRLSRTRVGAPLGRLRDFRFNDQLIWGLVVGITILVLPTLASLRAFGGNLVIFFGVLYVLRGLAVMTFLTSLGGTSLRVLAVVLGVLFLPITPALAFGLGVGDTWFDLRGKVPPGTTPSTN